MATKPIMYKPAPRWQFWAYLGGALLIHGVAVVAAIKREPPPVDLSNIPDAVVIGIDQQEQPPEPTPPPEEPEAPPPPPPQTVEPEFKEEQPTPPPKKTTAKVQPLARPQQQGATVSAAGAKAAAIFAPKPEYPYEARSKKLTGSGVCVVTVDTGTGNVTDATMAQSIGNAILDNSAVSAFKRWRFKPGAVSKAKIPVTFTMTGASF
jgi:TonB family protein